MKFVSGAAMAAGAALAVMAGSAGAATINVQMGPSAENFTLFGQGAYSPGLGSFTVGQGSSVYDSGTNTSTFTLSGAITGGTAGWNSGTYTFITTYAGTDTPDGGPNAPQAHSNPGNPNQFFYSFLSPSITMTLDLFGTATGDHSIVLLSGGAFHGGFGFGFQSTTCTGVAVCGQNNVGLTPGATISGPVNIGANFEVADVPEPAAWALMLVGFGGLGAALRARRRMAVA